MFGRCVHTFVTIERSNVVQFDYMGYPLLLVIQKCNKCGKTKQLWIDISDDDVDELLRNHKLVECKWKKVE